MNGGDDWKFFSWGTGEGLDFLQQGARVLGQEYTVKRSNATRIRTRHTAIRIRIVAPAIDHTDCSGAYPVHVLSLIHI